MIEFNESELVVKNTEWLYWGGDVDNYYDTFVSNANAERKEEGEIPYPTVYELTHQMKVDIMRSIIDVYESGDYGLDGDCLVNADIINKGIEAYFEGWE